MSDYFRVMNELLDKLAPFLILISYGNLPNLIFPVKRAILLIITRKIYLLSICNSLIHTIFAFLISEDEKGSPFEKLN